MKPGLRLLLYPLINSGVSNIAQSDVILLGNLFLSLESASELGWGIFCDLRKYYKDLGGYEIGTQAT